jgi:anti-sigma-K factor RskA
MRAARPDPHLLAGAYALDAVGEAERREFERHLGRCGTCALEVRGMREAAARIGAACIVRPPARLRPAVLAAAAQTAQARPLTTGLDGSRLAGMGRRLARWRRPIVAGLTCAVASALIVLTVLASGMQHRLDQARRHASEVAAVLSAPDARMRTARAHSGGKVTVVLSYRMNALVVTAARLRPLPPGQVYELWLMGPAGDRPAGILGTPGQGAAGPAMVSGLAAGDSLAVTVEPAGGAARPAMPPVVLISLG